MTVSCSGGAPATTWLWSTNGGAGCNANFVASTTATQTDTLPGNTTASAASCTYKVDVSNATGHVVTMPTATVTVAGTGSTPPIACQPGGATPANVTTDLTKTIVQPLDWNQSAINATSAMKAGVAWVGVLTVPANVPGVPSPANGRVAWADYGESARTYG